MKWILPGDIISHFWIGQLTTLDANPWRLDDQALPSQGDTNPIFLLISSTATQGGKCHIPLCSTRKDQERAEQERRISVH
jgi:hypothetical protein